MRVFLNAGHALNGVPDPGAVNNDLGLFESNITRNICNITSDFLKKAHCKCIVYQSDDLPEVVTAAEMAKSEVFVSVHCNSSEYKNVRGYEIYYYPGEYRDMKLAEYLIKHFRYYIKSLNRGIKTNKSFYVLRAPEMPSVLIETAFISNNDDAVLLRDSPEIFAAAIARGITDYWHWLVYRPER